METQSGMWILPTFGYETILILVQQAVEQLEICGGMRRPRAEQPRNLRAPLHIWGLSASLILGLLMIFTP